MTPARLAAMLALATALALALVAQNARIRQAGYAVSELRAQIAEQRTELAIHKAHLSKLKNPQRIRALVAWLGLDLRERPVPPIAQLAAGEAPQGTDGQPEPQRPVAALTPY